MNGNKLTISYQHFNYPPTHRNGKKITKSSRGWEVWDFGTKRIDTALFNIYLRERKWRDKLYLYGGIPIRGAVLFWMTIYPWLIKTKHKIQALYYQLAIESQYSNDKSNTWNPWLVQMRATKSYTCNGEP